MADYAGLENVDPEKLQAQYALTEALWSKLMDQGLQLGTPGNIEAFFFADDASSAKSLASRFSSDGWHHEISYAEHDHERHGVKVVTPDVGLSREAFLELVDVMMIAAYDHSCEFDGFQVAMHAQQTRSWWRFW